VEVGPDQTILEAAKSAGVAVDSACGGQGTCGKCKVLVTLGRPGERPGDMLSREEVKQGMVLACQATVEDDLVVEVPRESQRGELRILMDQGAVEAELGAAGLPLAERVSLRMTPPEQEPESGDAERLLAALQAGRGDRFSSLRTGLGALRALPRLARQSGWQVEALVGDFDGEAVVLDVLPPGAPACYGLAIDIGTTTVVVHLVDLGAAGFVNACAALNEQVSFGEDVISRIIHAQEHPDGLAELRNAVLDTINRCVAKAAAGAGISTDQIIAAAGVGNTVMTHLLLGIDPTAIRREPYVPALRRTPVLTGSEVGLEMHPQGPLYLAPCVSSYVGGDVTAGVLASGLADSPQLTLFIDLGTNGEMVIGHHEWLMCCSCSAGPAFEGSGLEYGMYATIGAIERLSYDPHADRVEYLTIGEAKPRGLCGSGLVDALASLLRAGVIDRAGRINLGFPSPRVRVRRERAEFVLVWGEEVGRADDISLGEDDIQNLIRSKAAVYAGAATLMDTIGLDISLVERVLVAGAFGSYLDAENAVTIGLLPDIPLHRIRFVGNTAVAGARLCLQSREARRRAEELAGRMTNFELSLHSGYMERYVSGLFLPHTDLDLFPSVAQRLGLAV
jgi:uncharacterized 2Fe-2S/4Fe-4S cluster protein (DUF4445 family)